MSSKPWIVIYMVVALNLGVVAFDCIVTGGDAVYFSLFNAVCAGFGLASASASKRERHHRDELGRIKERWSEDVLHADSAVAELVEERGVLDARCKKLQALLDDKPLVAEGPKVCPGCQKKRPIPVDDYICEGCRKVAV